MIIITAPVGGDLKTNCKAYMKGKTAQPYVTSTNMTKASLPSST